MFGVVFSLGAETLEVRHEGSSLHFRSNKYGIGFFPIEALKLSEKGIYKEFPDLEGDSDYKKKAIERLKEHINTLEGEKEKIDYIKNEFKKFGWKPMGYQIAGQRMKRFKD